MRFGQYHDELINKLKQRPNVWIHAVSVGEIAVAKVLVDRIRKDLNGYNIVISTITETGNAIAKKIMPPDTCIIYLPFDITYAIKRAIEFIKPSIFIIIETEIWPNLLRNLKKNNTPVLLANGRISDDSYKRYVLMKPILKLILNYIDAFEMQSKEDSDRIIYLGADRKRVNVAGNIKFDSIDFYINEEKRQKVYDALSLGNRRLIIAGSTHPGEEEILLNVYKDLIKRHSDLSLLIAPRHIERSEAIAKLVKNYGFVPIKISESSVVHHLSSIDTPIYILDSIGELKLFYSLAWVVFVGGSLIKHGGQSMIEPACFSKPIIFGPHTFNFKDIAALFLNKKAAIMVKDSASIARAIDMLYDNATLARKMGERARQIVVSNQGVADKTINDIKAILKN